LLVAGGTFTRLNDKLRPNSFYARSDPDDVCRVEERTFICSKKKEDAGITNNWTEPSEMKAIMKGSSFLSCYQDLKLQKFETRKLSCFVFLEIVFQKHRNLKLT
jgi:GTP-dependent phosphoenolpyruvate carboxykinase